MKNHWAISLVAFGLTVGTACAAQARHSDARHCAEDYRRFCGEWGLETRGLENCMRRHGDRLTNTCICFPGSSGSSYASRSRTQKSSAQPLKRDLRDGQRHILREPVLQVA